MCPGEEKAQCDRDKIAYHQFEWVTVDGAQSEWCFVFMVLLVYEPVHAFGMKESMKMVEKKLRNQDVGCEEEKSVRK